MQSIVTWPPLPAFVAVGAVLLLLVLFLKFRRAATGEVRLRDMAIPKPRSVRARAGLLRSRSPDLPARFERMDGAEFEAEVSELLRRLGFTVRPTPPSGVHDVDLLLEMTGRRVAVQLKHWNAPVGHRSVYGLFTARIHYATNEAWLITTSGFTRKAIKLAGTTGVRLIDGVELEEWRAGLEEKRSALPENDPEGPASTAPSSVGRSEVPGGAQEADASVQEGAEGTRKSPLGRA